MSPSRMVLSTLISGLMAWAWVPATQAPGPPLPTPGDQPAVTIEPAAQPSPMTAEEPLEIWLRGPFGRVPGGTLEQPAAAAPQGLPLDAFVRRAPLILEVDTAAPMVKLEVVARPLEVAVPEEILSTAATEFEGPDRPGQSLLVATLTGTSEQTSQFAWLIDVPDREPPQDGLYDIPAPEVVLESDDGQVAGLAGSGCYAYLCVDVGTMPPQRMLGRLPVAVGEVLTVHLSDGSAIADWKGSLSPLGRTAGRPLEAIGVLTDTAEAEVDLAGLEPPTAGQWLLELEVVFDRERGWLRTAYRLIAD